MDLRAYYRSVRAVEELLDGDDIVVVSVATPEGGRDGVLTEAPRAVAAKLIAEGRARAADKDETAHFHEQRLAAKQRADQEDAARRMQVVVVPARDGRRTRDGI
jgi:hypothetical protein